MPTTLVLGYDGSDCSQTALARTIDLAGAIPDAVVVVVYAFEFSIGYVPTGMTDSPLMMSAEFDDHAQLVRGYGEQPGREGRREARGRRREGPDGGRRGPPRRGAARDGQGRTTPALIVVGSHGEGAVSAAFLGSTALKLLHHSKLPVLVVPRHDKALRSWRDEMAQAAGGPRPAPARRDPRGPGTRRVQAHVRRSLLLDRRQHVRRRPPGEPLRAPRREGPRRAAGTARRPPLRAHGRPADEGVRRLSRRRCSPTATALRGWMAKGLAYAASLPPKEKKARRRRPERAWRAALRRRRPPRTSTVSRASPADRASDWAAPA